jgi:hypothetical protein
VFIESPLDGQDLVIENFGDGNRIGRDARRGEAAWAWSVATKAAALAVVAALDARADALLRGAACAVLLAARILGGELLASAGLGLRRGQRLGDVLQLPPGGPDAEEQLGDPAA